MSQTQKKIEKLAEMNFSDIKSLIGKDDIKDTENMNPDEVLSLIEKGWTPCPF